MSNIYRIPVDIEWSGASGSPGVNVWHVRNITPDVGNGQMNGFIGNLKDFYTAIQAIYPAAVTMSFAGEVVSEESPGTDPTAISGLDTWSVSGTGTSGFLPPANCIVLTCQTPHYGRTGRGRKFLGPLGSGASEANGTPTEPTRTLVQSQGMVHLVNPFLAPGNGAFAVYSRKNHQAYDLTGLSVPNEFGVLRSRRD